MPPVQLTVLVHTGLVVFCPIGGLLNSVIGAALRHWTGASVLIRTTWASAGFR